MDPITQQTALATAGAAGAGEGLYVDDVFSTYVYEGDGATRSISNDIDLAGEGGLVWIKSRTSATYWNVLFDTERGSAQISSNESDAELASSSNVAGYVSAYNSDGFQVAAGSSNINSVNASGGNYASWTFRKAPGFFDVVTYTGTGTARTVAHNLGSVPGTIIVKRTNDASSWYVYHRSFGATKEIRLNTNSVANTSSIYWNDTEPTSSVFTVGTSAGVNGSGDTYVAYIFAHDDQSFGTDGDESIIKCGSYTGTGSDPTINLGWEPQWILIKPNSTTSTWQLYDTMRGIVNGGDECRLYPAVNAAEACSDNALSLTPTGFQVHSGAVDTSGVTYVYIAIRRPHKPPTAATEVFSPHASRSATDTTPSELAFTGNFPVDLLFYTNRIGGTNSHSIVDRMRGGTKLLATASTSSEVTTNHKFDSNEGVYLGSTLAATSSYGGLLFRRAPGFFDIVTYEGNATAGRTVDHNLGVKPELMIVKRRGVSSAWRAYNIFQGATKYQIFNTGHGGVTNTTAWNDTEPTATQFTVGTSPETNGSGNDLVAYLFASLDGISKVGTYTGTGSSIDVDCGFASGARFILIKRYGASGDWFVYDSARGIVTGNDPYVVTNTTAAEVTNTDYIDPLNAGFTVTSTASSTINVSGGTYLYLAIA
jgi:hypothetical protein